MAALKRQMVRAHVRVYGLVQGVFYRKLAKIEADKSGIGGWARNDADGSVEIMASGQKKVLEQFVEWCKQGPPLAKVEKVEVDWVDGGENFSGFDII